MSVPAVLELFCGIGGCAAALAGRARIAGAIDINRSALAVYRHNYCRPGDSRVGDSHPVLARTLDSMSAAELAAFEADLWWLSPPCQPFTERGKQRDVDDPRARPFLALIERLSEVRPRWVALENVPGFDGSRVHARLRDALEEAGYGDVRERLLCPSELGVPNRRRRYYLVAGREPLRPFDLAARPPRPLGAFLDPHPSPELAVDPNLVRRYAGAFHIVDGDNPDALTHCFTSAYGRSHVRSGSYLRTSGGVRRFSPAEILRLLGFPPSYGLPENLAPGKAWPLVGNSLSLEPVRRMLATIPELGPGSSAEGDVSLWS